MFFLNPKITIRCWKVNRRGRINIIKFYFHTSMEKYHGKLNAGLLRQNEQQKGNVILTIRFRHSSETINFLVLDQIGKATEETAAEFAFKDCVHLFQENVFQLCSTCK